jgi:hypothetical protein
MSIRLFKKLPFDAMLSGISLAGNGKGRQPVSLA